MEWSSKDKTIKTHEENNIRIYIYIFKNEF